MVITFMVDSMVRGYHEYIASSVPILGEELSCVRILTILQQSQYKKNGGAIVTVGHN